MDFRFSPSDEDFRNEVREFLGKELPPNLRTRRDAYSDASFEASMKFRRKLGSKGWIGIGWPVEYGGLGAPIMRQMVFHEEMIYHNAPLDPQAYQVGPAIIANGSEYLKQKFLKATARQEIVWCQGFSEPDAGSDLAGLKTVAVRQGDDYIISGRKIWTTYAHRASWVHLLARTDPAAPKHKGISYFVVDMKAPGVKVYPLLDMLGKHHFNQVEFDSVKVPKEQMIGQENQGWYAATVTLNNERSGIREVTTARRQLDDLIGYLQTSKGHVAISDPQRHRVAEMLMEVQAARLLSYWVGWAQHSGRRPVAEPSIVKLFATELQNRIAAVAMQVAGLHGQLTETDRRAPIWGVFSHNYLLNVSVTIGGGTSEIQRNIIATQGLGLPR